MAVLCEPVRADSLKWIPGSTVKVCQLTGDLDRERGTPTLSLTGKRYGVPGTDLGSSFEHNGRLYFLFGDTLGRPGDRDCLAWTESADPEKTDLHFPLADDGKWLPLSIPGISQGPFEVPTGGISVGGKMVIAFTTDHSAKKTMGRAVLAVSEDDGKSFRRLYDLPTDKFINVAFVLNGDWLYLFGSGTYRHSSVCVARIKPADVADRAQLQFFKGVDANAQPEWSAREEDAVCLFRHDVVGELSVAYCPTVKRYVMLYNSEQPRGITLRSAETPWGPWSEGEVIVDPWRDRAYGHFIHAPVESAPDHVNDPGRDKEWGGEYGPYIVGRFTSGGPNRLRLYYTMSTWNPYQVNLMRSEFQLASVASAKALPDSITRAGVDK